MKGVKYQCRYWAEPCYKCTFYRQKPENGILYSWCRRQHCKFVLKKMRRKKKALLPKLTTKKEFKEMYRVRCTLPFITPNR